MSLEIKIVNATINIFKEKGVKFTMDDLANNLGVSKRTLYENIDSKETLLNLLVDDIFDSITEKGKEKYYTDIYQRLLHGEFSQKDSIHFDEKLKFQTVGGRTVYGGGGIMPDLFVPGDTVGFSRYLVEVNRKNQYLYDFTFDFMDRHRQETKNIKDYKQLLKYLDRFDLVNEMADYAAARGLKRDEKGIRDSYDVLDSLIKAFIGRHVLDDDGFYPIFYQNDVTIKKAIEAQGTGVQAD